MLTEATPEAFATAVVRLLRDPRAARKLGADAATQAARHTPARYAAAMLDVYARAVAVRAGRITPDVPARSSARAGLMPVV
jgi:hypothetical protein